MWFALFLYTYTLVNRARFAARFALANSNSRPYAGGGYGLRLRRVMPWTWFGWRGEYSSIPPPVWGHEGDMRASPMLTPLVRITKDLRRRYNYGRQS